MCIHHNAISSNWRKHFWSTFFKMPIFCFEMSSTKIMARFFGGKSKRDLFARVFLKYSLTDSQNFERWQRERVSRRTMKIVLWPLNDQFTVYNLNCRFITSGDMQLIKIRQFTKKSSWWFRNLSSGYFL